MKYTPYDGHTAYTLSMDELGWLCAALSNDRKTLAHIRHYDGYAWLIAQKGRMQRALRLSKCPLVEQDIDIQKLRYDAAYYHVTEVACLWPHEESLNGNTYTIYSNGERELVIDQYPPDGAAQPTKLWPQTIVLQSLNSVDARDLEKAAQRFPVPGISFASTDDLLLMIPAQPVRSGSIRLSSVTCLALMMAAEPESATVDSQDALPFDSVVQTVAGLDVFVAPSDVAERARMMGVEVDGE